MSKQEPVPLISQRNNRDIGLSFSYFNNYDVRSKETDIVAWGLVTFLKQWQRTAENWFWDNSEGGYQLTTLGTLE